jgi:hypothetical protein
MADWHKGYARYGLEPGVETATPSQDGITSTWTPVVAEPAHSKNWKFFGINLDTTNTAYPACIAFEFEWDSDDPYKYTTWIDPENPGNMLYAYGTVVEITSADTDPLASEIDHRAFPAYIDPDGNVVLMRIRYHVLMVPKISGGYEEAFEIPEPPE